MSKRLLDFDRDTGVATYHAYDHATKTTTIETVQDASPFLERNKALRNDADYSRQGIKDEWWHVATWPIGVQYQWLKDYQIDVMKWGKCPETTRRIKRKLMDPDWKYLTTTSKRI